MITVFNVIPSGTIDGENCIFYLPQEVDVARVTINGWFIPSTKVGLQLTLSYPPIETDDFNVECEKYSDGTVVTTSIVTPTGAMDGSNKEFTLPYIFNKVRVCNNGFYQKSSLVEDRLVVEVAPESGDNFIAECEIHSTVTEQVLSYNASVSGVQNGINREFILPGSYKRVRMTNNGFYAKSTLKPGGTSVLLDQPPLSGDVLIAECDIRAAVVGADTVNLGIDPRLFLSQDGSYLQFVGGA